MSLQFFNGRTLVVATMHGKEKVLAPVLEKELGVKVIVAKDLDTDKLGTFSGEIERTLDPVEAAREKCRLAGEQSNCSLAVASEGSFGPHPSMYFVPCDDEILVLLDFENNLEFKVIELTTDTNFSGALLTSWNEVVRFVNNAQFPSHAVIVRKDKDDTRHITKGINSWQLLEDSVSALLSIHGKVYIETDMRAMHNPSRMKVIERAATKLAETIKKTCPACHTPGFSVVDVKIGLPCELCGAPTTSTHAHVYGCQKCDERELLMFPHNKTTESPMYCNWCNP